MRELYPEIEPYKTFTIKVSELHNIYVEEVGNPLGKPVIFVHGGPGGGVDKKHRRYFDPKVWRVILFDQRGCGKSTPFGELRENTTFDLVGDMEKIRQALSIEKWHVFGGSWGSTLSLAYAITHPAKVLSMVLRGIFLVRKKEISWFYQHGASMYFPEEWQEFLEPIPKAERYDMVSAYHKRLNDSDLNEVKVAARAWSKWEGATSKLKKDPTMVEEFSSEHFAYAFARIENHYFYNNAFFDDEDWILNNAKKIRQIPTVIVQGRYDMPCPPVSAYELHKCLDNSELFFIEEAGHSASEPGIVNALILATDKMGQA